MCPEGVLRKNSAHAAFRPLPVRSLKRSVGVKDAHSLSPRLARGMTTGARNRGLSAHTMAAFVRNGSAKSLAVETARTEFTTRPPFTMAKGAGRKNGGGALRHYWRWAVSDPRLHCCLLCLALAWMYVPLLEKVPRIRQRENMG